MFFDGRPERQYKSAQTGTARADLRNSEIPGPDLIADETRTVSGCSMCGITEQEVKVSSNVQGRKCSDGGLQWHPSVLFLTLSCSSTFLIFTPSKIHDYANEKLQSSVRCAC